MLNSSSTTELVHVFFDMNIFYIALYSLFQLIHCIMFERDV